MRKEKKGDRWILRRNNCLDKQIMPCCIIRWEDWRLQKSRLYHGNVLWQNCCMWTDMRRYSLMRHRWQFVWQRYRRQSQWIQILNEKRGYMTMDNSMEMRRAREDHIVSLREKICYGLGDSACNVVYGLCSTLLTFFYTDYVGISAAVVGIIFLITRVFRRCFGYHHGFHHRPNKIKIR